MKRNERKALPHSIMRASLTIHLRMHPVLAVGRSFPRHTSSAHAYQAPQVPLTPKCRPLLPSLPPLPFIHPFTLTGTPSWTYTSLLPSSVGWRLAHWTHEFSTALARRQQSESAAETSLGVHAGYEPSVSLPRLTVTTSDWAVASAKDRVGAGAGVVGGGGAAVGACASAGGVFARGVLSVSS